MALIKCPECGHEISDRATVCPNCGYKIAPPTTHKSNAPIIIGVIAVAALVLAGVCIGYLTQSKEKEKPETVDTVEKTEEPAVETAEAHETKQIEKPKLLNVINVESFYHLAAQAGNTYDANKLVDGKKSTAWAVHLDDESIYDDDRLYGPVFTVHCKKLAYIVIRNGYGKNSASFSNNARAARVKFVRYVQGGGNLDNEPVLYEGTLKDTPNPQRLEISANNAANLNITKIEMDFDTPYNGGIYPGAKWNDLCISEVEFWGYE